LLLIALPLALSGIYLLCLAQERYVSESQVLVKRAGEGGEAALNLGALLVGGASTVREDAMLLQQYIHSPDMLAQLEKTVGVRRAFAFAGLDLFYRLSPGATREQQLDYYRARVDVSFDDKTSLLTIRSQGFTPGYAQQLNRAILAESERFINELSHKITREDMAFARQEVDRAYRQLSGARDALLNYQNRNGLLDAQAQAQAAGQLIQELQSRQAQLQTELRALQSYLQADAPQVVTARNALAALQTQITQEKAKLTAPEDGRLNLQAAQFQELRAAVDFQLDLYKLALVALEKTRADASHKIKSLAVITTPQLAQQAEYPRRVYTLAVLLMLCSLLYGVLRLGVSIIQDHRI
jgi:capsular polysaccharide transport system permease protein